MSASPLHNDAEAHVSSRDCCSSTHACMYARIGGVGALDARSEVGLLRKESAEDGGVDHFHGDTFLLIA